MKTICISFALILLCASIHAQNASPKKSNTKPSQSPVAGEQIDLEIAQRRGIGRSLLISLAIEARSYRDETLRARVQARIADVLWEEDKVEAQNLFRRAWEAAEAVDMKESDRKPGPLGTMSKDPSTRIRTNLRSEILKLVARRDSKLAEEFLAKLTAAKEEVAEKTGESNGTKSLSENEISERLRLANEFLEAGGVESALQFADPALTKVNVAGIQFLILLRDKNASAADQRFAALLSNVAIDWLSDANTVSLLTSYVFTPSIFLVVSNTGIPSSIYSSPRSIPNVSPSLRTDFFRVAANILLRPIAQLDHSSAGRAGTYFIVTRLQPLFQQFAPDLAPLISAQLAALGHEASDTARNGEPWLSQGLRQNDLAGTTTLEDELNGRLSRTRTSDERDRAYAYAAMRLADEVDERAKEYLDKIEDLQTRNGIRSFVDYQQAMGLLRKQRAEEAVQLARKAELSHVLRAHIFTKAAEIVAKKDEEQASKLLEEALEETRRVDKSAPERAYSMVAIVAQFSKINKVRAWELLSETIKTANGVGDFNGENGQATVILEGKVRIRLGAQLISANDIPDLFANLAEVDFYQAIDVARTFKGDAPRALATIAIARSVPGRKRHSVAQDWCWSEVTGISHRRSTE